MRYFKNFLLLFLMCFCLSSFSQNTTNTVVVNGFQITTIVTSLSNSIVTHANTPTSTPSFAASQTNNSTTTALTNMMKAEGYSTNAEKITGLFIDSFINQLPFYKNGIVNLDGAAIYNFSHHSLGWFGGIDVPTGAGTSLGFGVVDMKKQLDILPLSIKTGLNVDWPWLGEVYHFVSVGSAYDFTDDKLGTYSAFGAVKTWGLAKKGFLKDWKLSVGAGISDISTYQGLSVDGILRLHCDF